MRPLSSARVPLADRGHLLGDGVFETMRVLEGRVFQRDLHDVRLGRGLATLGLRGGAKERAWDAADALAKTATRRLGKDLRLRLQVTTGESDQLAGEAGRFRVTATARPFEPYARRAYEKGLRLVLTPIERPLEAPVKSTSFHAHASARRLARTLGADDAVFLNAAGRVCEATTSNLIAMVGGRAHAPGPSEGALDGTTRHLLLRALKAARVPIATRLTKGDLLRASEVVLTNVSAGVAPVERIDGHRLRGPAGPHYAALQTAYASAIDAFRTGAGEKPQRA